MDETTRAGADRAPTPHDDAPEVDPGSTAAVSNPDTTPHEVTAAEIDQAAALVGKRAEHLVEEMIQAELETGKREESVEAAKRHIVVRVVRVAAGVIVLILGLVLLAAPGPGLLVITLGLGLLAQDVPFARNLLDKVRARLPQDENGKLPRSTVIMMVVVSVSAVVVSIWFTLRSLGD